jgi:hypothetical protein
MRRWWIRCPGQLVPRARSQLRPLPVRWGGQDLSLANNEQLEGRLIALEFMLQGFTTVTANGAGHVAATRVFLAAWEAWAQIGGKSQ